jgi:hypothetical protein
MWGEFKKWSDYFVNKREIIVNLACIANKLVVTLLSFLEKIIFLAKNKKDYINYSKVYNLSDHRLLVNLRIVNKISKYITDD